MRLEIVRNDISSEQDMEYNVLHVVGINFHENKIRCILAENPGEVKVIDVEDNSAIYINEV